MKHAPGNQVHHSRNNNANPSASARLLIVGEQLLNATGQLRNQDLDVLVCLKTTYDTELMPHQIGEHDVGTRSANIDTDNTTLPRIDVQECWTATATNRLTDGPFENQRLIKQFTD